MTKSKLIEILRTFKPDELKKFDDFISSPYYNKLNSVIKLFRIIEKYAPEFNDKKLDKSIIYKKIFPGKTYNDKIMRNLQSELVKLSELFLELSYYEKQKGDRYENLLNELLNRQIYKSFESNFKLAENFLTGAYAVEKIYLNQLSIISAKHSYDLINGPKLENVSNLSEMIDPLLCMFSMYFFKINYNMAARKFGYNSQYDLDTEIKFIDSIIEYVKRKSLKSEPIILMYYDLLMLYLKPEDDIYFEELENLKKKYNHLLDKDETRNFYIAMTSYCQRKSKNGNFRYNEKEFELYREMLQSRNYSTGDKDSILPLIFKNILKCGIVTKNFDWTINFIEEYKDKLSTGYDENLYNFSYSYLYFKKKEFNKSLIYLSKVNYNNVYDKLDVKDLLIQLYYEADSLENITAQVDAFRHFLQNDKIISNEIKNVHMNFIKFVNRLINIKYKSYESYNIESFKKDLLNTIVYDKGWLLEKIEEIKE